MPALPSTKFVAFAAEKRMDAVSLAIKLVGMGIPIYTFNRRTLHYVILAFALPVTRERAWEWAHSHLEKESEVRVRLDIEPPSKGLRRIRTDHKVIAATLPLTPFALIEVPKFEPMERFKEHPMATAKRFVKAFKGEFMSMEERTIQDRFVNWTGSKWNKKGTMLHRYEELAGRIEINADQKLDTANKDWAGHPPGSVERALIEVEQEFWKKVIAYSAKMCGTFHYKGVEGHLAKNEEIQISQGAFDRSPYILNTPTGIVDLKTGQLHSHRPEAMCSLITEDIYDPEAEPPKLWLDSLHTMMRGNRELVRFLHMRLGSTLIGDNPEQCATFCWGLHGEGGKSTIFETLVHVLGGYGQTADADTFLEGHSVGSNRSDLVDIMGARLVQTGEPNARGVLDVASFKKLTGGDTLRVMAKYERPTDIVSTWKIFISFNDPLPLEQAGHAVWRRIQVIPFDHVFDEADRISDIKERLKLEGPQILKWLIDGARLWYRNGSTVGRWPKAVFDRTQDYKAAADSVRSWLGSDVVFQGPKFKIKARRAYQSYQLYCKESGLRPVKRDGFNLRLRGVAKELSDRGIKHDFELLLEDGVEVWRGFKATNLPAETRY